MARRVARREAEPAPAVRVWLFGQLAALTPERPLLLTMPPGATVGNVVEELGRRLGACLLDRVMDTETQKLGICRLFLDGENVELTDPLPAAATAPDLELIVLTASEGG